MFERELILHFNLDEFSIDEAIKLLEKHRNTIEKDAGEVLAYCKDCAESAPPNSLLTSSASKKEWCIDIEEVFYKCFKVPFT